MKKGEGKKKVLVTGGAGFLGSHLVAALLERGHYVICADNYFTGQKRNVEGFLSNPRFEAIEHDICDPLDVEADDIYNLACPASPAHYQRDPIQTWKTSVLGALNMLELAARNGARILHTSTSEVYGDPEVHPQPESYWGNVNPIGLRACYDESKRAAETLFFDYHRRRGVRIKVVRLFNTYGPLMHPDDGRVVSNFIRQAILGEDITVYGDGSQTRAFCYVDDMIEAFLKVMDTPDDFTGPVNLGTPAEMRVIELAKKVLKLVGSNSKIIFKPLPSDDPTQREPDISLAKEKLGWSPSTPLDEGLKKTIEYFRAIL